MRRVVAVAVAVALCGGAAGAAPAGAARASPRGASHHAVKRVTLARCAKQRLATALASAAPGGRLVAAAAAGWGRLRACGLGHYRPAVAPRPVAAPGHAAGPAVAPVAVAAPATALDPAPAPPATAPTAPVHSTLGVSAYDRGGFLLLLTRSSVPAGELTVFFRNEDVSVHNLWIEGPGNVLERVSDTVGEGDGAARTLAVGAGQWRLFCSLPDHGAMARTLSVTP
ncbi:MAG: hypothetical protein QOJ63_2715 [Solirubrobacteraceae bacterium]|jgi:hypothetical protein|nr:hypothetical protein [Solirubrobacteraceae bacterium]